MALIRFLKPGDDIEIRISKLQATGWPSSRPLAGEHISRVSQVPKHEVQWVYRLYTGVKVSGFSTASNIW